MIVSKKRYKKQQDQTEYWRKRYIDQYCQNALLLGKIDGLRMEIDSYRQVMYSKG